MTKAELMEIEATYDFEIARDPITHEAWGLYRDKERNDEIDKIIEYINSGAGAPVTAEALYFYDDTFDDALYRIWCPTSWFDLWGWK